MIDNAAIIRDNLTSQEVFDFVVGYSATMTQKAQTGNHCVYRTPDKGCGCFIGCVMTDEEAALADNILGGSGVLKVYEKGVLPARLEPHLHFLKQLQSVHDNADLLDWPIKLREVAKNNGLKDRKVNEAYGITPR